VKEEQILTTKKVGFTDQIASYPRTFWVANVMEIFERMSWYGWYTVMAVYVTGSVATGGLGFSTELRGALQGIVPFFLYLFPVVTGALADRYGYKRMFIIAYLIMIVAYFLLGQFTSVPTFFMAFMFVAVGAAIFKPVVVGTVAKVTDETNSSTGFGIFYMMVNIGGFAGPIVAGMVRGWGWEYVFIACSTWALVNLLIVLFLYREPTWGTEQRSGGLRKVLDNAVEVLGNLRFFITVFVVLFALMFANLDVWWFAKFSWKTCWIFIGIWLVYNIIWDRFMPKGSGDPKNETFKGRPFMFRRMHCSNWRFALFLLIMSGFWTSFNQIFLTMPEYIRDFVDTRPAIRAAEKIFGKSDPNDPTVGVASKMATINELEREEIVREISELNTILAETTDPAAREQALEDASRTLLYSKVRISPDRLREHLEEVPVVDAGDIADKLIIEGRQINPEFIVNINAGAIVLFQVLISFMMCRFHRFTTMIVGMVIASIGIGFSTIAGGGGMTSVGALIWVVAGGIFIFSFGEMMASPTSQEYVGRIAPKGKTALYMGYYFVAVALGNLFGGILSGELMRKFTYDMGRPDYMWALFGGIMLFTALIFLAYDKFALPRGSKETMMGEA
jgi:POT family proton-dependent oligopeptide transporter